MNKKIEKKEEKEPKVFKGTITKFFTYKNKKYFKGKVFETKKEKLFNHLINTKRIRK